MEKEFLGMIPDSSTIGMDKIVKDVISQKKIVKAFTINSGFLDIGDKRSYLDAYKKYVKKLGSI